MGSLFSSLHQSLEIELVGAERYLLGLHLEPGLMNIAAVAAAAAAAVVLEIDQGAKNADQACFLIPGVGSEVKCQRMLNCIYHFTTNVIHTVHLLSIKVIQDTNISEVFLGSDTVHT